MMFDINRRGFLAGMAGAAAVAGTGKCFGKCAKVHVPGQKIKLAAVGVMGKGFSDWMPMVKSGLAEIVALCDADAGTVRDAAKRIAADKKKGKLPADFFDPTKVPFYTDYRKLLDDAAKLGIEAMTVSTSDHMHAPIAIRAMKMGIHVYVQKPLVRTLWEAKYFYDTAKECGVVTQMGNQGSALPGFRRGVEVLQSGILGDVTEVHVWTNRPVWPQGTGVEKYVISASGDKVPKDLNWDAWLGTARERPFLDLYPANVKVHDPWRLGKHVYHPFTWRGFFDFGCGAFGDMACHTMNLPFRGLELGRCTSAECTMIEEKNTIAYPMRSIVKLTYAARDSKARPGVKLPTVTLFWYDGNKKPSADLMPQVIAAKIAKDKAGNGIVPNTGCLVIGTKGVLCSTNDYGGDAFLALKGEKGVKNIKDHEACKAVARSIPYRGDVAGKMEKGPGAAAISADGHYIEFLDAICGNGPVLPIVNSRCYSDVDFSVPIMEGILVGCVAQRVPGLLNWDSCSQTFDNAAANSLVKPYIRKGFEF